MSNQVLGDKHEVEAKSSQVRLQKKPNRPNTDDPRQDPRSKAKHQIAAFGKRENGADSNHHGQPVMVDARPCFLARRTVFPLYSRVFSLSFAAARFLAWFFGLCYILPLKGRMYLAYLVRRIHSILSLSLSNSIEEEERRRRGIRQKATSWRQI